MPRVLLGGHRLGPFVGTVVVVSDAATKWWSTSLPANPRSTGLIAFVPSTNAGVSFSGFSRWPWLVMGLTLVGLLAVALMVRRAGSDSIVLSGWLLLGGGVANVLDRVVHAGHVTDFIAVGSWFICNVADVAITLGVSLLIVQVLRGRKVLR